MNTEIKYNLNDLWDFSDKQILQILKYFKAKSVDNVNDRLESILLSYDNDLLEEIDIKYVESDRFDELFLSSDEQLRKLSGDLGYNGDYNHIDMIKFIIDNDIKIVDSIPLAIKDKIEIYQMNKDLYVCGVGTFKIKDDLKSMNGRWDAKNKCWTLPLIVKPNLMKFISKPQIIPVKKIHSDIPIVNQIPTKINHNLELYQINNDILLCGKKTYDIKDDLKLVGSQFNGKYKCWSIPHDQIDYALDLVKENEEKDILEKERIQAQKTLTRLNNLEEKNLIRKEKLIVQKRLDKEEKELPYVYHIDRLSKDERNKLTDKMYDLLEQLDAKELKKIWKDKIIHADYKISEEEAKFRRKHERGSYYYVTYIGDYRPSDYVLELYANDWHPLVAGQPGYSVKRVDYKIYEIYAFSTD